MENHTIIDGTKEYLDARVTASVELTDQPVAFSFDRETWHDAEWVGDPGTSRVARLLLTPPGVTPPRGRYPVLVRIIDNPEEPIFRVGEITAL